MSYSFESRVERKINFLLDEDSFYEGLNFIKKRYGRLNQVNTEQVIYYYDTPVFSLLNRDIVLRVMKAKSGTFLQIKCNTEPDKGIRSVVKFEAGCGHVPKILKGAEVELSQYQTYENIGELVINRREFLFEDGTVISFNIDRYLGKKDYEIEVKFKDSIPQEILSKTAAYTVSYDTRYKRFADYFMQQNVRRR